MAREGIPAERCRYHICWGSFNSPHVGDVPFYAFSILILLVMSMFLAIGLNYADHVKESGFEAPPFPVFFNKQSTCVVGPSAPATQRCLPSPSATSRATKSSIRPRPCREGGRPWL